MQPPGFQGLHLDPNEFCAALEWSLVLDTLYPNVALTLWATTQLHVRGIENWLPDTIKFRDVFVDFYHQTHLGKMGGSQTSDGSQSRPADVLVRD